jgi:alkanesulfonate monooxygenase SsuD/methylene tetrahydromethanopterin reductase-like flavin-dependent oxidoreductase (luciferase family)
VDLSRLSIGLPGATEPELLRELAPRIEAAGFRALWLNDTAAGDSLTGLRVVAGVTEALQLATGVIPLDRRPASTIAAALHGLPVDRLTLGVGAGGRQNALARVSAALDELRAATSARLVVGALGPRMRRLGAEAADGVLLSWLTPEVARSAMDELRHDARGRPVRGILYARTAMEPNAVPLMVHEAEQYESYPAYAANFARIGARAIDTTIDGTAAAAFGERVSLYTSIVDELVLRAVPSDVSLDGYTRFVHAVVDALAP